MKKLANNLFYLLCSIFIIGIIICIGIVVFMFGWVMIEQLIEYLNFSIKG